MIEKNFNIKQRAVNETPAMTGFHSQNLFKLPHERRYRKKMIAVPATGKDKEDFTREGRTRPSHNVALELLSDTDSDVSECNVKTRDAIIEEYKSYQIVNKNEKDCRTI